MAWTYTQDFNALNTADLNSQDSWVNADGAYDVQTSVKYEGAKAVSVLSSGSNHQATRSITAVADGILQVAIRASSTGDDGMTIQLISSSGTRGLVGFIQLEENIGITDYSVGWAEKTAYSADTWYLITVDFDATNDTYRFKIDDGAYSNYVDMATTSGREGESIISLGFQTSDGTHPATYYYDDIRPYIEPVASTDDFLLMF